MNPLSRRDSEAGDIQQYIDWHGCILVGGLIHLLQYVRLPSVPLPPTTRDTTFRILVVMWYLPNPKLNIFNSFKVWKYKN